MLPNLWSVETASFHSSLVKCLHLGHGILFVSSGFLETEALLLTLLIKRGRRKEGSGELSNDNAY